jgi:hypothetical protein
VVSVSTVLVSFPAASTFTFTSRSLPDDTTYPPVAPVCFLNAIAQGLAKNSFFLPASG